MMRDKCCSFCVRVHPQAHFLMEKNSLGQCLGESMVLYCIDYERQFSFSEWIEIKKHIFNIYIYIY